MVMMDEDDIPEDVKRGVEKALFGGYKPVVATKRRHFGDRMRETPKEWLERRRREEREKSGK